MTPRKPVPKYVTQEELTKAIRESERLHLVNNHLTPVDTVAYEAIRSWWSRREPLLLEDVRAMIPKKQSPWISLAQIATLVIQLVIIVILASLPLRYKAETPKPTSALTSPVIVAPPSIHDAAAAELDNGVVGPGTSAPAEIPADGKVHEVSPPNNRIIVDVPEDPQILTLRVTEPDCWVEVQDGNGHVWQRGPLPSSPWARRFNADEFPLEIRSGCPGKIRYFRGGEELHPTNLSRAPGKSEIVELR